MSRIKKGDLVKIEVEGVEMVAVVITKPKEKPFLMSPRLTSMRLVADLLVEHNVFYDMDVLLLEKIDK